MAEFLKKKLPEQKGNIIKKDGTVVGTHQGARFYTLGQRHQLFLPFKAYVTDIDVKTNTITVGDKEDEKLLADTVCVTDWTWTGSKLDKDTLNHCLIKIRYRQEPALEATLLSFTDEKITFHIPQTR